MKEREPTGTPRGVKVAILALGVLLVAGFALFGGAMSVTKDLRGGAKSAAVAFAKDAALGISPEGVQKSPPALDALRLKAGFETTVTDVSGPGDSGAACVTISASDQDLVRVVVVVKAGVGEVVSYGPFGKCQCPAKLEKASLLTCS